MLSQQLIRSSKSLQSLQFQGTQILIHIFIDRLQKSDKLFNKPDPKPIKSNETQLQLIYQQLQIEFIQIDQEIGDQITKLCLNLIEVLVRYRTSFKQFQSEINMLLISKQRKQYFTEKIKTQNYELRKIIYAKQLADITQFKNLQWRFQIEVASKTSKNTFIPNMFLTLHTLEKGQQKKIAFNSDFANLKNMHQSLQQAMKMHHSNKFKTARYSQV